MFTCFAQNVEVLASRSTSQQTQVGAELRVQALEEENERLRGSLGELEQSVARLQRQAADLQGDEAKAKDTLRKYEVSEARGAGQRRIRLPACEQFQEREGMYCHNLVGRVPALVTVSSLHTMLFVSPQVV